MFAIWFLSDKMADKSDHSNVIESSTTEQSVVGVDNHTSPQQKAENPSNDASTPHLPNEEKTDLDGGRVNVERETDDIGDSAIENVVNEQKAAHEELTTNLDGKTSDSQSTEHLIIKDKKGPHVYVTKSDASQSAPIAEPSVTQQGGVSVDQEKVVPNREPLAPKEQTGPSTDSNAVNLSENVEGIAPETVAPERVAPETVAPETVAPETVAPETVAPETVAPKTVAPETVAPETVAPETVAPETVAPETVAPETVAPETVAPETVAPETVAPETVALETVAPETVAPETVAPETVAPETVAPETVAPETVAPETVAPETVAPETVAPETVAPETVTPETVAPETVAPETVAPETAVSPTIEGAGDKTKNEPLETQEGDAIEIPKESFGKQDSQDNETMDQSETDTSLEGSNLQQENQLVGDPKGHICDGTVLSPTSEEGVAIATSKTSVLQSIMKENAHIKEDSATPSTEEGVARATEELDKESMLN